MAGCRKAGRQVGRWQAGRQAGSSRRQAGGRQQETGRQAAGRRQAAGGRQEADILSVSTPALTALYQLACLAVLPPS